MNRDVTIAEAIKFMRLSKEMSARQLSLRSGLSPSYVGKVESGRIHPSFHAFCCISKVLEMSDHEVLFLVRISQRSV